MAKLIDMNDAQHPFRRRRTALGLSQEDVAAMARIDQSTISRIERGQYPCPLQTIRRIAVALDVPCRVLTGETRHWERSDPERFTRPDPNAYKEIPW